MDLHHMRNQLTVIGKDFNEHYNFSTHPVIVETYALYNSTENIHNGMFKCILDDYTRKPTHIIKIPRSSGVSNVFQENNYHYFYTDFIEVVM